ncbi:P-loop containing nucleoside triphosphate hydrolase protein [Periconia macrospinosa]|uniref:P-loop containing nucleoside triphosphate hydrolase protein n=1 Tax=Periconia macrospinosa TaxID=97972 RepID=A0A2V1D233_9PLEO|nr:P-loop containing nucleoside triphosphate hydrolase protein [Periconia macrospinosa]
MATSSVSSPTIEPAKLSTSQVGEEGGDLRTSTWKDLFGFTTRRHLPILFVAFLAALVAALANPAIAVVFGSVFHQFTEFGAGRITAAEFLRQISKYCTYLTAFGCASWIANSIYFMLFLSFGELQAYSARQTIFTALLRKDMAWYDTRDTGIAALLPSVQMQIRDLQLSLSQPFGEIVQCIFGATASLAVALYSSWNLTLVVICSVPVVYIAMSLLSGMLAKRAHEQSDMMRQALAVVTNTISHIESVKYFNGEHSQLQKYLNAIIRSGGAYKKQASIRSMQMGITQFFTLSIFVQGFWYGSYLVMKGEKNPGQVLTTFWAAMLTVHSITAFLPQYIVIQKGKVAGARLKSLAVRVSKDTFGTEVMGDLKPQQASGNIEFRRVSFAYPSRPDQLALRQVSINFAAGHTTFVIGRSGSGKSTLGQLLVRFYRPSSGIVRFDGVPLEYLDTRWLRQQITLVEQHSVLFNDTISHNIALGCQDREVSQSEIQEVVTFAMLQQMIKDLPKGYDTVIGSQNTGLSGGQRQRMALARARLRDTPVLILDESTSALDYITRSAIIKAIREWRANKTTIIITHDISQILPDDRVYVMDNAQLVQQGVRKEMETQFNSPFTKFLETQEEGEPKDEIPLDDTEEIMSLYTDSEEEGLAKPNRRSFVPFFRQSIIVSPFDDEMAAYYTPRESLECDVERPTHYTLKAPPGSRPSTDGEIVTVGKPRLISVSRPRSHNQKETVPTQKEILTDRPLPPLPENREDIPSFRKTFREKREMRKALRKMKKEPPSTIPPLRIMEILGSVWPRVGWSSRLSLIAGVICALIHAAATPTFGYIFSQLLETFYNPEDQKRKAMIWSLSILAVSIIDGLATYGWNAFFEMAAQTWVNALKLEAMKRLLMQPREFFEKKENDISRLAECLDQFAEEARNLPGRFCGILLVMLSTMTIAVIWSMVICWRLTLLSLASLFCMLCIIKTYNAISHHWERLANEADETVGKILHETFVNIRTVRCLCLEKAFGAKYSGSVSNSLRIGIKRSVYSGSMYGLSYASSPLITALLFFWGGYNVSKGYFPTIKFLEAFNILMLSVAHVGLIANYIPQINVARDAGSRLIRLTRLPQDSHELSGTDQLFSAGDISLNKVNFTYPARPDHPVLHDVSFEIPSGSCTAIVGTSGSGKSTIAALLLKLYPTPAGDSRRHPSLSISGQDINRLHTFTLRSRIAVVSQTPVIFPGTIAENIIYGLSPSNRLTTPENIRAAAEAAGAAEFIESLPQSYRTAIGEGGTGLSGGQAQRIAIARALVREPDILILDEATSALDVESAGTIRDTIQRLVRDSKAAGRHFFDHQFGNTMRQRASVVGKKQMTVIIITHAKEMMAIAEHIVMLDKGRVVDEGSFDELKRRKGAFAQLLKGKRVSVGE